MGIEHAEGEPRSLVRAASDHAGLEPALRGGTGEPADVGPAQLDTLGLVGALRRDLQDLTERTGMETTLQADVIHVPDSVERALYRMIHEALNGIAQHARATHTAVILQTYRDKLFVVVHDDGAGLMVDGAVGDCVAHSAGLIDIRRRTELLQGQFEMRSAPEHGSSIRIVLPLDWTARTIPPAQPAPSSC
jgi:signal transduction histidine kinase